MAKFEINGVERIIDELGRMDALTGPMAEEMIREGAKKIVGTWKSVIERRGHVDTGAMLKSVKSKKPSGGTEVLEREIYPLGKDAKGVRNAEKAFILHYGWKSRQGDHFIEEIMDESVEPAVSAMEAVMDRYVKE